MDINRSVSMNMKRLREARALSLDGAAKATGVSKSMLGQIERGEVNPTISILWKIANGLKVSFTSLVEDRSSPAELVRGAEGHALPMDGGRYRAHPLFPFDESKGFEVYRIEIAPGGCLDAEAHLPGCEEYITVFQGEAAVTAGGACFALGPGDALRFRADVPHRYENTGAFPLDMSMIITYRRTGE